MPTTLITGANRGIGLALTREFLANGHDVIATARDPGSADALNATGATVMALDVADPASIAALKAELGDKPIDYLINNAGVGSRAGFEALEFDQFERILQVNTISPLRVIAAFADNVAASGTKKIANLSSIMGSIENTTASYGLAYRTSKAGLNMALRAAAPELAGRGITLLALHPGWVQTDMGGSSAPVKPEESAAGLFKVITGTENAAELRFFDFEGNALPW